MKIVAPLTSFNAGFHCTWILRSDQCTRARTNPHESILSFPLFLPGQKTASGPERRDEENLELSSARGHESNTRLHVFQVFHVLVLSKRSVVTTVHVQVKRHFTKQRQIILALKT